MEVKV